MQPNQTQITPWQLAMLMIINITSTALLLLPGSVATFALRDAWLAPIVAAPVGALVVWIAASLSKRFPGETLAQYAPKIIGNVPGKLVGLLFAWYFFHLASLLAREFSDFLVATTLPKTPVSVMLALTLLASALAVRLGPELLGRLSELFTPFALVVAALILVITFQKVNFDLLLPFMEFGPLPMIRAGFITQGFIGEMVALTVLFASVTSLGKGVRASYMALVVITLVLSATSVVTIGTFGDLTDRFTYPFFAVARIARIGPILARIDPLVIGLWIGGVALKLTVFFYASVITLAQVLGLKEYRPLCLPMAGLIGTYSVAQMVSSADFVTLVAYVWPVYAPIFNWVLPAILLIVATARKLGKAEKRSP